MTREALVSVGGFDSTLHGGECIDWVARFDSAGLRWAKVADVVLHRRIHDSNKSRDPQQRLGLLEVARRSIARKAGRTTSASEAYPPLPRGESD